MRRHMEALVSIKVPFSRAAAVAALSQARLDTQQSAAARYPPPPPTPSLSETTHFAAMGCMNSKPKNYPSPAQTGRANEPNYTDLSRNVANGGFSANHNGNAPARRPQPAKRDPRANFGASSAGSHADSEKCFPDLVKFRLDESEVLLTRKVSSGAFGVVWLGHYHGQPVAVKRMIDGEDEAVSFSREIETMSRLSHPKIVRFIGCTWTNKKDLGGVSEYMDGGDVRTLLETRKIELSWKKEKISIAIDIAEALAYMHSRSPKIIHRDLKSRNVLLNSSMVAKLSDFGLSRNRTYEETLTAGVGTVRWTAPEVMLGDNYSEQADVYSFGVVLSELDTREIPFEEKSSKTGAGGAPDMAIVIKVAKGELRPSFAPDCPDVILRIARACLQFDPALRPDSESVVQMLNDARVQLQAMS
ncbi:hypothetical protein PF010_g18149 [Phytophthora fragariae]|uniref:Protein kinase domain-containing protein n=3 Tax=Phytophthora TaxID=4783 RepID=A0A6A3R873_9STRA|nr:hypothetical protein PF003_g33423 [Phytophthora fragariae]KAE8930819.1 hypothetical protein PF009_g19099 [Phytophthora fragariae]KAE8992018.1 hypothetical protein PF011_g17707 [Phytophthora fragariae]KAE9091417.1 hypothetical protein PF007_g18888 [Phytophthora fragariae]KAE9091533.1 hypothetical protein PF010_g18149 [Phytophthora fragariae]